MSQSNVASKNGREHENLMGYFLEAQGLVPLRHRCPPRLVGTAPKLPPLRFYREVSCRTAGPESVRLDFVVEADAGAYNPIMFPGWDPSQGLSIAIEGKAQSSTGSADDKLIAAYLKLAKPVERFSHKLLVTHIPSAGKGAISDLTAIYRGDGILRDDGCGEVWLRAVPHRNQWVDMDTFVDWLQHAFPLRGDMPSFPPPSVFVQR